MAHSVVLQSVGVSMLSGVHPSLKYTKPETRRSTNIQLSEECVTNLYSLFQKEYLICPIYATLAGVIWIKTDKKVIVNVVHYCRLTHGHLFSCNLFKLNVVLVECSFMQLYVFQLINIK